MTDRKLVQFIVPEWRVGGGQTKIGLELERTDTTVTIRDLVRVRTTYKVPIADVSEVPQPRSAA